MHKPVKAGAKLLKGRNTSSESNLDQGAASKRKVAKEAPLDSLDLHIVELLRASPRASSRSIARATNVSELTAGNRIRTLMERGDIKVVGHGDMAALGYDIAVHVNIQPAAGRVKEVTFALTQLSRVQVVDIVTAPPHILAAFVARNKPEILDIIENDIGQVDGIESMETIVCLEIIKQTTNYAN
jgi:DNA-binding Lrp family transcriptional regulator